MRSAVDMKFLLIEDAKVFGAGLSLRACIMIAITYADAASASKGRIQPRKSSPNMASTQRGQPPATFRHDGDASEDFSAAEAGGVKRGGCAVAQFKAAGVRAS